ncbi:MAG TPA: aminotransferase class I/II-fold pyridoxal phosphate-dependent enzyme, partial [Candidatus Paceibacterota bacterium]|nr:aminotransferase class I/II-fold pyridoxal phosphate-dependent enzyme [Candidatus Paceibacterota bacterium]
PMAPEYIGYADQGLEADLFVVCRPAISWPDGESKRRFKYHIDFAAVEQCLESGDIAAITVSRPTNPTGNVLTEEELIRLSDLAARYAIFLVVDNAYGVPFPKVVFTEAKPYWAPHVINLFSLSKLGLPGVRTGIVVGPSEIAAAIQSWTAIVGLANNNVGQQLVLPLIENGELLELGPRILQPFYRERSWAAQESIEEYLGAAKVDWALHVSEGAFFLWLWLRGLRYTSRELYRRLKSRNVLIVPGEYFFYGLSDPWPHQHECVRISFSQSPEIVREGIRRLAEVAASRG